MVDIFKTSAREIGIYVDEDYRNTEYVQELIESVPKNVLITFPFITKEDVKIRNEVLLKAENPIRYWKQDEFEIERIAGDQQELLADHMFISYLKFFKRSKLFIFPHMTGDVKSLAYSSRAQALIIKAHLLNMSYAVIKEGSLDEFCRSKS